MPVTTTQPAHGKKTIALPNAIVIKDLAQKLSLPVHTVVAELMKNGVMSSMNEKIDFDTAAIVASELGFETTLSETTDDDTTTVEKLEKLLKGDDAAKQVTRPPVVVVMGHVDHGKTKLLDAIRQTDVVAGEAGGITQHIGAYQVSKKGRAITFIDTPGHEAFTAMRSRGARVADIAILVVAADDGFKPQTIEAMKIIQQAKIPFVVAINKIDKPDANVERVKQQLAEKNLLPEEWGGKVTTVPISATKGTGIEQLLDHLLLLADVEGDKLRADPTRTAVGSVIEAHIDKGEGPIATVIVQTGTLRVGDHIRIGNVAGKVKALKNWHNATVREALPSLPVRILGLKDAPEVGDLLTVISADEAKELRRLRRTRTERSTTQVVYRRKQHEDETKTESEPVDQRATVNVVLRSDNLGTQEAILENFARYESTPVHLEVVSKGLGNITEADVLTAATADALLVGFNVIPTSRATDVARGKQVDIKTYKVIYALFQDIRKAVEAQLPVEHIEKILGKVRVLAVFKTDKKGMILGGRVLDGVAQKNAAVRVFRDTALLATGRVTQVQQDKKATDEVKKGSELGMRFDGEPIVAVQDVLEFYVVEERRAQLPSVDGRD